MSDLEKIVQIDYTNHRGERRFRYIVPLDRPPQWENNKFHPESQWILYAVDMHTGQERGFAMKDIHSWRDAAPWAKLGEISPSPPTTSPPPTPE